MTKNTTKKAETAAENAEIAAIEKQDKLFEMMAMLNVKLVSAGAARKGLAERGVSLTLGNTESQIAMTATLALEEHEDAGRKAAMLLGVLAANKTWKDVTAPDGKPFKKESDFYKELFPSIQYSTVMNLMHVGRDVYLPIATNEAGYEGLEEVAELPPTVARELVSAVKDEAARKELPAAIRTAKVDGGKVTQKVAAEIAKEVRPSTRKPRTTSVQAGQTEEELYQETAARLLKALRIEYSEGEFSMMVLENDIVDWLDLLKDAQKSKDTAAAFVKALAVNCAVLKKH